MDHHKNRDIAELGMLRLVREHYLYRTHDHELLTWLNELIETKQDDLHPME